MNTQWHTFIENQGHYDTDGDVTFTQADENAPCQKFDLSRYGIIQISGEDKQTFLQGQLTSDTRDISESTSQLSSYCTPKGRMLASFRIFQQGEDWYVLIPRDRLESTLKRLQMFVLMSKVSLSDMSNEMTCIGLYGTCSSGPIPDDLPEEQNATTHANGLTYIRVESDKPRYLCVGPVEAVMKRWDALTDFIPGNTAYWRLLDIRAAIPTVYEETVEAFIPQMTNLQLLNGVSFTKGCYTGQEVVARMQYLGKLKRRMYPISFTSTQVPSVGDDIFSSSSKSGQGAGKLVDVVRTAEQHYEALAVIEIDSIEKGTLQLFDENGPELQIEQPPYSFETEETKE